MIHRLPSTDALRAFETVARLASFERAAKELSVTTSAVRKRLTALEELVGTPLLERRTTSTVLTERGSHYLDATRDILRLLHQLPIYAEQDTPMTVLRITATPTFARQILAPNLPGFAHVHPHVELELVIVPPVFDYPSTNADIEIRAGDGAMHGGVSLTQDVAMPLASPLLLKTLPPLNTPQDLLKAPLIRTQLEPWQAWFQAAGMDYPEPHQGPKFQDLGLTYEAAAKGHGIALCRLGLVKDWLVSGALQPLFAVTSCPPNQYYALVKKPGPESQAFLHWLQGLCKEQAAEGKLLANRLLTECAMAIEH